MLQSDEQGIEPRAECSGPPRGIVTLYYIGIKRFVREIARRQEGMAKHIIGRIYY